jgi:hypothetical protein
MKATYTATSKRALLARTRKTIAVLSLFVATGIAFAPTQAFATTDWQYMDTNYSQYAVTEKAVTNLFIDMLGSSANSAAAIEMLHQKIDLFEAQNSAATFWIPDDETEQSAWNQTSPTLNYLQHGTDTWLQNEFGHSWNGEGKGHYKGKHKHSPVVPIPAAVWLFGSAMGGLLAFRRFSNKGNAGVA